MKMEWLDESARLPMQPKDAQVKIIGRYADRKVTIHLSVLFEQVELTIPYFERFIDDEEMEPEILQARFSSKINKLKKMNFVSLLIATDVDDATRRKLVDLSLSEVQDEAKPETQEQARQRPRDGKE